MNPRDQPRFEEKVRSAAGGKLDQFLARTTAPKGSRILVRVLVRTVIPLSPGGNQAIRETLEEVRGDDTQVRLQVHFEVAARLPDGYEIRCERMMNVRAPVDGPPTRPREPAGRDRLLIVSFGVLRFDYLLTPGPEWWPLARPGDRRDGTVGFVLPQSMSSVPSGSLLELRLDGETLRARRTGQRLDIGVMVNNLVLHPALRDGPAIAPRGQITYLLSPGQPYCVLDYNLTDWAPETPSPAGPSDPGDGASYIVSLTVDNQTHPLHIAPPRTGDRAVERKFPIPAATADGRPRYLDVQVLYTTGTWSGTNEWHVKIYRCATPQHADQLRRYLRTQSSLVDRVNAAVGGTGQAPPWAVAPVSLLPPGSALHGGPRDTELHVTERDVRTDPENRLSAWFGAPEQPQPNCFVIVASPMLKKVGWADSTLRSNAPGIDQLPDLMNLAKGLDRCHELGIAHCDVKPENVCRNVRGGVGAGYVLIDGDAVSRTRERLVDLRLTLTYASPRIVLQWRQPYDGNTPADLREHDRFGFALVVLAAVAGADRVAALLVQDERGERPVDTPDIVTGAITSYWPPRWFDFAVALATPFQGDALVGDEWTAVDWLDWLSRLSKPPPDTLSSEPRIAPQFAGVHARHLAQIREEVRASPRGLNAWVPAVVDRVIAHQLTVARAAYWKTVLVGGLLPLLVMVAVLVMVVIGVVTGNE